MPKTDVGFRIQLTAANTEAEVNKLVAGLARYPNLAILSDEIYSEMLYGGRKHISLLRFPQLRDRVIMLEKGRVIADEGLVEVDTQEGRRTFKLTEAGLARPIDEFMAPNLGRYRGKELKAVDQGPLDSEAAGAVLYGQTMGRKAC